MTSLMVVHFDYYANTVGLHPYWTADKQLPSDKIHFDCHVNTPGSRQTSITGRRERKIMDKYACKHGIVHTHRAE
jgi:hypothetical protein